MRKRFLLAVPIVWVAMFLLQGNSAIKDSDDYWVKKCAGEEGDSCGYADRQGNWKIRPGKYLMCFTDTFRKMAIVYDKRGFIGINRRNEKLFNVFVFDNGPDYVFDGLFRIQDSSRIGYADMNGNIIISPRFDFAYPFSNGLAAFNSGCKLIPDKYGEHLVITGGKWGLVNKKGEVVIKAIYDDVFFDFDNGEMKIFQNDTAYSVDENGRLYFMENK